jgi:hypothetical protein
MNAITRALAVAGCNASMGLIRCCGADEFCRCLRFLQYGFYEGYLFISSFFNLLLRAEFPEKKLPVLSDHIDGIFVLIEGLWLSAPLFLRDAFSENGQPVVLH